MAKLVEALTSGEAVGITTALHGAGGFGKTTLAEMVAASPQVRKRFKGGVDTFTVGRATRGPARIAEKVNEVIKWLPGEHKYFSDPDRAGQELGALLDTGRPRLLILDDVWEPAQLRPFIQGGSQCARLVTTRDPGLLADLGVAGEPVGVDRMSPEQARELLTRQLPPLDPAVTEDLVAVARGWPLLLALVNRILVTAAVGQDVSEAGRKLIGRLRASGPASVDKLRKVADVDPDEPKKRAESVQATIKASTELLEGADTDRFRELVVFAENEAVPVDLVALLWQATAGLDLLESTQVCHRLASLALVPPAGTTGGVALHDVIRDFLREKLGPERLTQLHGVLLDALAARLGSADPPDAGAGDRDLWECLTEHVTAMGHTDYPLAMRAPSGPGGGDDSGTGWWDRCAEYIGEYCVRHLVEAGRRQQAEDLACDVRWVLRRLEARGTAPVLADLAEVHTELALELRGVIERFAHMLGWDTARPDAGQILLNVLRQEPGWAQQATAMQASRREPTLVSHWPLPDNPGPALRHVYKVPIGPPGLSGLRHGDAVTLSPDGSWLAMAGDGGIFIVDTSTRAPTSPRLVRAVSRDQCVSRIAITRDGSRIAALDSAAGTITVHKMADGSVMSQCDDDGALWSVAFTPDGASLVTTGNDGHVKGWNALSGERLRRYDFDYFPRFSRDHNPPGLGSIDAVVSNDGQWVVSGGENKRVYLWSLPDGRPLAALSADPDANPYLPSSGMIEHVAVAPDRLWIAGSAGRKIHIWDTGSRELITTLEAQGLVTALALTNDGSHLASGDRSGTILVWDCGGFTLQARFDGHGGVKSLGFSPDGQLLYSGGGGEARAWELRKATTADSPGPSTPVERVLPSPEGTWVAVAVEGGDVHIRDAASGAVRTTLTGHPYRVRNITVAPDGTWLATEAGGTLFIWGTTDWALAKRFDVANVTGEISSIFSSADSRMLFTVDAIAVRAWDPRSGKMLIAMAGCLEEAQAVTFSHEGSWLAAGDYYGTIWVWDADTGNLRCTLGGGYLHGRMRALAAAPGNRLLACQAAGPIQTWDIQHRKIVSRTAFGRCHAGTQVAISPDGRNIMTCGEGIEEDGTVTCYDIDSSQEEAARFDEHDSGQRRAAVAFSGDGRWFAFGGPHAQVWERATHHLYAELGHKPDHFYARLAAAIALSFRGDRLASASGGHLAIRDTSTSEVVRRFEDISASAIAFSPDGRRLGIAVGDRITILDIASGERRELAGNVGPGLEAAISPSGQHAIIVGPEGVQVVDVGSGHVVAVRMIRGYRFGPVFAPGEVWFAVAGFDRIDVFTLPQAELWKSLVVPQAGWNDHLREIVPTSNGRITVRTDWGKFITMDLASEQADVSADVGRDAVDIMVASPNGKWLATGGRDLSVRRLPELSLVATHGMNRRIKSLAWSPDGNGIIAGGDGGVYLLAFENQPV